MSPTGCSGGGGQANLVALAAALFALTTATVVGVALANGALGHELREPDERRIATSLSERLVAEDSPLTDRRNALNATAVESVGAAELRRTYPALENRSIRVSIGGEVIASDGTPAGGSPVRRLVLIERSQEYTTEPPFSGGNRIDLPRRTSRIDLGIRPPENVSVETVRANDRVVLHDPGGLRGDYTVSVSRRETATVTVDANGSLSEGDVSVTVYPRETTKTRLAVTVDA